MRRCSVDPRTGVFFSGLAVILSLALARGDAGAQPEPFYKGKTLQIVVGSATGAGNDMRTRLFARHLPKHLPGAPNVIVQNMPGAGGLRARNYVYNIVKPDGLTIAQILRGTAFQEAIGDPEVKYKADRFNWLGNLTADSAVCIARIDRAGTNLKEAIRRAAESQLRNAESGSTSTGAVIATLVREFTGLNLKVVTGYAGGSAIDLAIERGEADMRCGLVWSSAKTRHGDWFRELGSKTPFAAPLVQISENRLRDLPDVPTLIELAPDRSWRGVAEAITFTYENAYPMLAPPGVPDELVALLRKAFWATVHDPEYRAEAKKMKFLDDEPVPGEKVQKIVKQILEIPDEAKTRLRKLLGLA
ncbi:MAG TPA: tripartite tricarboxylate transporter substrate-binding protein [Candidatus Acidoferrales bacterium]|nr:tripartite tricarboxylate transporter substrate-binding protein [Candidatus Acidoferrales bacterium]